MHPPDIDTQNGVSHFMWGLIIIAVIATIIIM